MAAPPLKPSSASAASTTAAEVQLDRSAGKWFSLTYCQPVQYEPSSCRSLPAVASSSRARSRWPQASREMTSSHVSATVTHGWSLTQRTPRPGTTNASQPRAIRVGGARAAQRAAEHRVVPVHREPALVRERLGVAGDDVAELVGGELPVRLRLPGEPGDRDRAAQPVQDARAPGKQRERAGRAGRVPFPRHLAARRLQAEHPLGRPPDGRPHPQGEPAVAGDQVLVPGADRGVGGVVALRRVIRHLGGARGARAAGRPRPGAVRALRVTQPLVGKPGGGGEAAGAQRHRALHVVPRVHVAVRPGDRPVGPLYRRDRACRLQDVGRRRRPGRDRGLSVAHEVKPGSRSGSATLWPCPFSRRSRGSCR